MSLKLISKYRTCLMALAMIWIGFNHSYFPFTFKPFSFFLVKCGYAGVDMFLFLSGFGLFYACEKQRTYKEYTKRRLIRILPYNVFAVVIGMFIYKEGLLISVLDMFGLSMFFRNSLLYWFTSFILVVYALYPFFYNIFKKAPYLVTTISVIIVLLICLNIKDPLKYHVVYEIYRIIPLVIGTLFAHLNENDNVNSVWCWIIVFVMILGWCLMYYMYHYISNDVSHVAPLPLIIPGMILLFSFIIDRLNFIQKPLNYIGQYSFQFYLFHEKVILILNNHYSELFISGIGFDWWINIIAFVGAFILAILYKKLIDKIMSVIMNKTNGVNI